MRIFFITMDITLKRKGGRPKLSESEKKRRKEFQSSCAVWMGLILKERRPTSTTVNTETVMTLTADTASVSGKTLVTVTQCVHTLKHI